MSELNRTAIYFAVALVVVGLAIFTRPSSSRFDVETMIGEPLVDEFDIDAPQRLAVTRVDAETGQRRDFEVAEKGGLWTIPSKGGYPADATANMVSAVEGIVGRTILAVATDEAGRHAEFGVLDPATSSAAADAEAVGTRVKLTGADDEVLADVIIGKAVKDTDGKQHYVRLATQDAVYAVEIDPAAFSTDFSDWIEKDLLGLSTFDIQSVKINDYSAPVEVQLTNQGLRRLVSLIQRGRYELRYDDENSKWDAESLETWNPETEKFEPFELQAGEELNADALREMRTALDDLTIVDVDRKPAGLSADLKAGDEFLNSREAISNLANRGFMPIGDEQGNAQIYSSDGELIVTLKSGVEYVLRFGDIEQTEAEAIAGAEPGTDADDSSLSRYLFVTVRMNETAIERPELEELPPLPEANTTQPDGEATEESTDDSGESDAESDDQPTADTETKTDTDEIARIRAERAAIEDRNNAALRQYEEQLKEGRQRVEELNVRFGDWYYLIGNDVFKKVHLSGDQLVQKKEQQPAGESSPLGAPAGMIPGLPNLPGLGGPAVPPADAPPADSTEAEAPPQEPAGEGEAEPMPEEPATEEPAAEESATEEPTTEEPTAEEAEPMPEATEQGAAEGEAGDEGESADSGEETTGEN
jgi:hypothetical protein